MRMLGNLFIFIIYFFCTVNFFVVCRISNERRCVDADCSVPISLARTKIQYYADDERLLSFPPNVKAKIFSKEAGSQPFYWEAEINGKRGYVPKDFMREEKMLVKPSEIKHIVPTGKLEESNHNISQSNTDTKNLNHTPELPVDSSKGLFSNILGVSADSVPPNSPEINPQSTHKYEVVDGTTLALYDDHFSENLDESPQFQPSVQKTSPIESVSSKALETNIQEESSEIKQTNAEKENSGTLEINIKESTEPSENVEKENVEGVKTNINESNGPLENVENESGVQNVKKDSSVKQSQSNVESEVLENNKQELTEKLMKMAEITQEKPESIDHQNVDPIIESNSESSIIENIVNSVSNLISSGVGEIEDEDDGEEVKKLKDKGEFESADEDNDDEYSKIADEITSPLVVETINKYPPDNQVSKTVEENVNLLETKNVTEDNLKNDIEKDKESIGETEKLSTDDFDKLMNKEEKVREVLGAETVELNKTQVDVTEEVNLQIPINDTSAELENNVTNEQVDSSAQDKTGNTLSHPNISSVHEENEIPEEDNSLNESSNTSNEQKLVGEEAPSSANLDSEGPATIATGEEDSSEVLTVSPVESLDVGSKINTKITKATLDVTGSFNTDISVDAVLPQGYTNDSIDNGEIKDNSKYLVDGLNIKPVYEEPEVPITEIQQEVHNQPLSGSTQTTNKKHSVISEVKQAPTYNYVASDSPLSSLPLSSGPYTNQLEVSKDLSTAVPEKVSVEKSSDEVVDNIEGIVKDKDSSQVSSNPLPDFLDEILMAEEEIKAKSSQLSPKDSILNQVNEINTGLEASEDSVSEEVSNDDSEGFFSWLKPVFELFKNSNTEQVETSSVELNEILNPEILDSPSIATSQVDGSCPSDKLGEGDCGFLKDVPVAQDVTEEESFYSADMIATLNLIDRIPLDVTIWLVITAVVLLVFSLGHYYIEAHRRDGPLVAVINKLEREVLILKKENSILEDRLQTVQQELESWNTNSAENDALIVELKQELEETKSAKQELEEQVTVLEREVESVTENGLEIHRMLEESLSSQDGSQVLLSTVETLREKLEHQEDEIAALSQRLSQKNMEVEELEKKLAHSLGVSSDLEERVIAVTKDKEEEALQLKDKHRQLMAQLEEAMETKALDETRVSTEMSKLRLAIEELQKAVAEKDAELEEVKEVVKQLRSTDSNDKMDALFDVVGVRAQLRTALTERDDFREKFQDEEGARKLLEGHMKKITQEVAELKVSFETAEKEKIEALTKLQVLSNYFKEKESQLQKELGVQESMWLQKQSDDHTIYEQMRSLREENEKYKLQNESLKKEIVEQESSFKIQIANVEQKSHENWVASRQAERRLKEVQQEAAQLRNRLTMEKNSANYSMEDGKPISESNGDPSSPPPSLMYPPTSSPPFMMYPMPPPPGDFVPPPPLMGSPYPSDSRPPPLGRISSPPLDHRFSPPPPLPYPPFDYPSYGHHSPSPPPPMPSHSHHRNVHKPQPREISREQKEHVMSNYSSESDNTVRKNKR